MSITTVIITKNSDSTLEKCIRSAGQVSEEIIIVDSGSTDNTITIAEKYFCKIIRTKWLGYGPTKNLGHYAASNLYILSLDSDEELSSALINEINFRKENLQGYYFMKRLNRFGNSWIKHGAWYPDKKIRLFPKQTMWNSSPSHEQLILDASQPVSNLKFDLLHYAYKNVEDLKNKTYLYAQLGAAGKSHYSVFKGLLKMIVSPIFGFIRSYFIKLGVLEGLNGLIISYYNALGTFLKYKYLLKNKNAG
ncbi:MAG: glycosyltransferase family 2 protein [Pedobacter sp.]|nr:MAG: glycosyltransferase family 2 protein [Pedobacter sp.]